MITLCVVHDYTVITGYTHWCSLGFETAIDIFSHFLENLEEICNDRGVYEL